MYIIGFEPALPKPHYLSNLKMVREGLLSLLTNLRNQGHQVKTYMEEIKAIKWEEIKKEVEKADLIAISTISATHPRGEYFASLAREIGKPVVMGGPHVTFCSPEESLKFATHVIGFEGDISLPLLVEALEEKRGLNEVPNLSYRSEAGEIIQNSPHPEIPDFNLDDFPFPDFSLVEGWRPSYVTPIVTSRGCPYSCTFCCVHKMFPKVRFRRPEAVVEEIKRLKPRFAFFSDDNFAINKKRTKEILSLMLTKLDKVPRWGAQVRYDIGRDRDLLRLFVRTGCSFLCIGFESFNNRVLEEMNKKQSFEEMKECLSVLEEMDLLKRVHGSFAVGADADTKETAIEDAIIARQERIRSIQIWVLTPFEGTQLYEELDQKDRILSKDPGDHDGTKATFIPAQMSPEELQESVFAGMKRFYSFKNRLISILQGLGSLVKGYAVSAANTKDLWKESFREAGLKWYGNKVVRMIEKRAKKYLKKSDKD